jgi:2-dehydro-3-deoxyglucarate aldolase/4-hydroxy-2-oxoheptanedioate aldolase
MTTSSSLDRFLAVLDDGKRPALGTVVNLTDSLVTEVLASAGVDFVWIDLEHSAMSLADVNHHIAAARGYGVAPFVRVPWNDAVRVKPILEMGPAGIVFPFVNSAAEAVEAVAACRYPPAGVRGFCPHRANDFGGQPLAEYLTTAQREPWVVVQIEHVDAVAAIEEICAVPGIDSLLVGPFDLSVSAGKPGQIDDPAVQKHFDHVARIARDRGVPLGAFALSTDEAGIRRWIDRGTSWLALDTEYSYLTRGVKGARERVTRLM